MQYDPNKQGFNNYRNVNLNQYPSYGGGNAYPPNNTPPPQYPQYAPPPVPYHQGVFVVPAYRTYFYNFVATPITPSLRTFFIISGILYLLWEVLGIGLEIGVIANSYHKYYLGFSGSGFLIGAGVSMLIASCRSSYIMVYMIQMFSFILVMCILAFILCIVNYSSSTKCYSSYYYNECDLKTATQIKATLVASFVIATIQTIVSLVVTSNAHKRTTPASNAPMA